MMQSPSVPGFLLPSGGAILSLDGVDLLVICLYFVAVIGIGLYLKSHTKTGEDFFMAGREMTAWIAGLSFLAANLGSLELMGWAGAAYQYGILATHWYWVGAIPAMLFLGLVMMPFYYICKTHSVPGYLQLRYGEGSRTLAAVSFGFMTVLMSRHQHVRHGQGDAGGAGLGPALQHLDFVAHGGRLRGAGRAALGDFQRGAAVRLDLAGRDADPDRGADRNRRLGWDGGADPSQPDRAGHMQGQDFTHLWSTMGTFSGNPMGIHWTGIVFGLGWVISFGYWTTDFLVVQRVMSAKDLRSAKMAPIIGAAFKMFVPFIVILPGLLGLAVLPELLHSEKLVQAHPGWHSYNDVLPLMLARYLGPGLLGLGVTALIAGFMSGMAGNVTAFSTVWTYDIYKAFRKKELTDAHLVRVGRWATIVGVAISIGAAYFAMQFQSIMDYVQALFSFFIAPLFGTVIFGMLWKRATPAAGFWGLLAGTASSIAMYVWVKVDPTALRYIALSPNAKDMAENMYRALWSWLICAGVTIVVSYLTQPKPESELVGLVYGIGAMPHEEPVALWKRPIFWAGAVIVVFFILNLLVW